MNCASYPEEAKRSFPFYCSIWVEDCRSVLAVRARFGAEKLKKSAHFLQNLNPEWEVELKCSLHTLQFALFLLAIQSFS
eukprot:scaffold1618_cov158-Ochromonas_danica.AAC.17